MMASSAMKIHEDTSDEVMVRDMREAIAVQKTVPNIEEREYMTALAKMLAESALCAAKSPADAFLILQACYDLGLPFTAATDMLYIVNGKISLSARAMRALIYHSGKVEVEFGADNNETQASVTLRRKDGNAEKTVVWTIDMAKTAGLIGNDPWKKYPRAMLENRALSECARQVCPDVTGGLYTDEEVQAVMVPAMEEIKRQHPDLQVSKRIGRDGAQALLAKLRQAAELTGVSEQLLLTTAHEKCLELCGSERLADLNKEQSEQVEATLHAAIDAATAEATDEPVEEPELDLVGDRDPFEDE